MFKNKNIILGITGSIAAYKSCDLVRKLVSFNANVFCVMTKSSKHFISPLTLQTLSKNRVFDDLFEKPSNWQINHIDLAQRADIVLVAPASANVIGKLAAGLADDLLTCLVLATKAPVLICPAMNAGMYNNLIVQDNMNKLKERKFKFVDPSVGELACGIEGIGRLADVGEILKCVSEILKTDISRKDLGGKNVLITAGPTREYFDPIRFLSNPSSGRMGYALAKEAQKRGAKVVLISGPTNLDAPDNVEIINVTSASEMENEVQKYFPQADVVIGAAAVSDWFPGKKEAKKIKKRGDLTISLKRTTDILSSLGLNKGNKILIGFAVETDSLQENAREKLITKNLDFIVANKAEKSFGRKTNEVIIIDKIHQKKYPIMTKEKVASIILDKAIKLMLLKNK